MLPASPHIRSKSSNPIQSKYSKTGKQVSPYSASESSSDPIYGKENSLRKNFSILSILGVGFGLTNSWCGISASLVAAIYNGGSMTIVYGIVIVASISLCVAATLSELTSAMPNAGGQYVWTKILAPKRYAPFWSFLCGQLSWIGSVFTAASVDISLATMLTSMYTLTHPDYIFETWHVFLAAEIVHWFVFIFNCYQGWLPYLASASLYITITSWLVISITVLACSKGEFQSAGFVFAEFNNRTGWTNPGIAFITGLINPAWSFACLDSATHMAEEVMYPERVIPIAVMGTVVIGFITAFSYSIAMFFSIKDLDELLNNSSGFPALDIYYQVLGNKAGAIVLCSMVFLSLLGCNIQCQTWSQRLCWSFARDNGIWGSKWWSKVNTKMGVPLNAHIFNSILTSAILCIYLGSTTAYNALVTGCVTFLLLSYAIPTVFLMLKKRNIKKGPFWLGSWGWVANYVMLGWAFFALIFFSFPFVMPAERETMNYASCATVGVVLYSVVYWFARGNAHFIMREFELELETVRSPFAAIEIIKSKTSGANQVVV